jgi:excisionase family DNA binding protein
MTQVAEGGILTTFQAARLCGVSHKSIERWVDAGLLRGFRTPGGHRRVHRVDLLEFIQRRRTADDGVNNSIGPEPSEAPRVLIVDDDPCTCALYLKYFQSADPRGYRLEVASSGYEAGRRVERFRPHVVLLDLMMPDLDGFEVCRNILNDPELAATMVIAITGSEEMAARARMSGGFQGVFVKPVRLSQVREAVDSALAESGFAAAALACGVR